MRAERCGTIAKLDLSFALIACTDGTDLCQVLDEDEAEWEKSERDDATDNKQEPILVPPRIDENSQAEHACASA